MFEKFRKQVRKNPLASAALFLSIFTFLIVVVDQFIDPIYTQITINKSLDKYTDREYLKKSCEKLRKCLNYEYSKLDYNYGPGYNSICKLSVTQRYGLSYASTLGGGFEVKRMEMFDLLEKCDDEK